MLVNLPVIRVNDCYLVTLNAELSDHEAMNLLDTILSGGTN